MEGTTQAVKEKLATLNSTLENAIKLEDNVSRILLCVLTVLIFSSRYIAENVIHYCIMLFFIPVAYSGYQIKMHQFNRTDIRRKHKETQLKRMANTDFNDLFLYAVSKDAIDPLTKATCCECVSVYGHVPEFFTNTLASEIVEPVRDAELDVTKKLAMNCLPELSPRFAKTIRSEERSLFFFNGLLGFFVTGGFMVFLSLLFYVEFYTTLSEQQYTVYSALQYTITEKDGGWFLVSVVLLSACLFSAVWCNTAFSIVKFKQAIYEKNASWRFYRILNEVYLVLSQEDRGNIKYFLDKYGYIPLHVSNLLSQQLDKASLNKKNDDVATTCAHGLAARMQENQLTNILE